MSSLDNKNKHSEECEIDEATSTPFHPGEEYDGIRELDNSLPKWWVWMFALSIVFAIGYLVYYEITDWGASQAQEYENEMAAAPKKTVETPSGNQFAILTDATSLDEGRNTFNSICATCHGTLGQGLVGPNMTDSYWIHGSSVEPLFRIVENGVLEKGMVAYKDQLGSKRIQNVLSYIFSLQGVDVSAAVPPAKAQEGAFQWNPKTNPQGSTDSTQTALHDTTGHSTKK